MENMGIRRIFDEDYEAVLARVPGALSTEGFGVLTEIDVKATLKKKLDVDFRRYKILGACNPPFAHKVLSAELEIGLLLPCNVLVYETDEGKTVVSAIDPIAMMASAGDASPEIAAVAEEVRAKLVAAVDKI
ncbi:MAG: DUF302 domain-containing protein [Deltaproteobacteria bacterium]|nr:DUF302 domain-containing protein [Deltaproteobacteria bacterium]